MPLKGKNKTTGAEALVFDQFDAIRQWSRDGLLICPFCEEALTPVREHQRTGAWVQVHLRHKTLCSTSYNHHPESPEHHAAKRWIRDNAAKTYKYPVRASDCEVRMPDINRIADVCFDLESGERIVHEAQLAAITIDELEARTNDYQSIGCAVVWHFGKRADTPNNRTWAFQRLGGCEILAFEEQIISV